MRYQIEYSEEARHALRTIPGNYRQRIRRIIEALADEPRPKSAKELRELPNRFRIRLDHWRIIYRIVDDHLVILIINIRIKVGPETYSDLD